MNNFSEEIMRTKRDSSQDDGGHSDKRTRRNDDQVRVLIPSNVSFDLFQKSIRSDQINAIE